MKALENVARALLLVIVALLPFEARTVAGDLSILQLFFAALAVVSLPLLIRHAPALRRNRLAWAAGIFVLVYWITALTAGDLIGNSMKAALRVSCGAYLLCVVLALAPQEKLESVWSWSAVGAAVYGILDYFGFGWSVAFREAEFYVGNVLRLSGSFEYPNTAGAFFAMSLPIVWARLRYASVVLWVALVLTYSRGALIGIFIVLVATFLIKQHRDWLRLAGLGAAVYSSIVLLQAVTGSGLRPVQAQSTTRMAATYSLELNQLRHSPDSSGVMPVGVRNTGDAAWQEISLSYHWYDTVRRRIIYVPETLTPLPRVEPNQSVSLQAAFRTPDQPGAYLLVWDLKAGTDWFSIASGVTPGIVEASIEDGVEAALSRGNIDRWYKRGEGPILDASIDRAFLWRAGWQLFIENPIGGIGPDNFRLRYGQVLGYSRWDANVRANNLYLELLAGSGLLGLLSFALLMTAVGWSFSPAGLSVGVFLVHGLADAFLMTTPIYFAFWLLLGRVHASRV